MIFERAIFGEVSLKIDGFDTSLLAEKLCHICKVISLYSRADSLFLTTLGRDERKVNELVIKSGCVCEVVSRRGAIYTVRKYIKRFGVYFGAILAAAVVFMLSNIAVKIEVRGTDDPALIGEITSLLREEGLRPGAYIPSQNFLYLGNFLFTHCDGVSWASIGASGSVVYVNVNAATVPTEDRPPNIPRSIVSAEDAVITRAEVSVGQLCVLLGDAVHKGELLVSGIINGEDGVVRYRTSIAKIIGRYEKEVTLSQGFIAETSEEGITHYRKSLKFFELELPLSGAKLPKDREYAEKSCETPVKLFGLTLPFSVKTYQFTEIKRYETVYDTDAALGEVYRRLSNYERNILKDVEIISREITEQAGDTGVSITVKYVLEGEIGRPSEIFIK